jgi:hypothetical protein
MARSTRVSSHANGCASPLSHLNRRKTRRASFGITGQEIPCRISRNSSTTHLRRVLPSHSPLQKSPAAPLNLLVLHNVSVQLLLHHNLCLMTKCTITRRHPPASLLFAAFFAGCFFSVCAFVHSDALRASLRHMQAYLPPWTPLAYCQTTPSTRNWYRRD